MEAKKELFSASFSLAGLLQTSSTAEKGKNLTVDQSRSSLLLILQLFPSLSLP